MGEARFRSRGSCGVFAPAEVLSPVERAEERLDVPRVPGFEPVPDSAKSPRNPAFVGKTEGLCGSERVRKRLTERETAGSTAGSGRSQAEPPRPSPSFAALAGGPSATGHDPARSRRGRPPSAGQGRRVLPPTSGGLPVRRSGTAGGGLVYRQRCRPRPTRVGGRAASPEPVDVVTWSWPASGRAGRRAFSSVPAQPGSLGVNLPVGNVTETEVVTAAPLVVDVTSAVVAEAITLDLSSGRSYQSCPWLVPGVLSEDADAPGNPASKSGLNHRDIGGEAGVSRDNVYYIDSINVTDGVSRTFGANFNTEIRPTPRRANLTRTISVTRCGGWLCPRSVKWWTGCPGGESRTSSACSLFALSVGAAAEAPWVG